MSKKKNAGTTQLQENNTNKVSLKVYTDDIKRLEDLKSRLRENEGARSIYLADVVKQILDGELVISSLPRNEIVQPSLPSSSDSRILAWWNSKPKNSLDKEIRDVVLEILKDY